MFCSDADLDDRDVAALHRSHLLRIHSGFTPVEETEI